MPNQGTINGAFSGGSRSQYLTFRCDWSVTSQDTANRTSDVLFKYIVTRLASDQNTYDGNTLCTQTQGSYSDSWRQVFDVRGYAVGADYLVWQTTRTIAHGSDGLANVYVAGTIDLSGTSAGYASLGAYISLPRIDTTPPTVSLTATDVSTPNMGAWVSGKSIVSLLASATAQASGATIAGYAWYRNGVQLSGSSDTYTAASAETAVGNVTFKVVVTDSYENSAEASITINFLPYSLPTIATETFRCLSDGTASDTGTYASVKATFSVANVGDNLGVCTVTVNGHTATLTSGTATLINAGLSSSQNYDAAYVVTDSYGAVATKTDTILSEFMDLSLHPDGGFAFGEMPEAGKGKINYDLYLESGKTLTIGSTTLTEAQLIQLLALI